MNRRYLSGTSYNSDMLPENTSIKCGQCGSYRIKLYPPMSVDMHHRSAGYIVCCDCDRTTFLWANMEGHEVAEAISYLSQDVETITKDVNHLSNKIDVLYKKLEAIEKTDDRM